MSRKNVILTAIILVMVAGSAFVLYKGLYSKPEAPAVDGTTANGLPNTPVATDETAAAIPGAPATAPVRSIDQSKILPLGTKLEFTLIKKYNVDTRTNNYPKVDPLEVGAALIDLIKKTPWAINLPLKLFPALKNF